MIKKIILGALCVAQFSLVFANNVDRNLGITSKNSTEFQQKVPKTVIIKTKKFKIRIDQQPNGKYLYQSWPANAKITSKPSMIISDGQIVPDGSGGNYYYEFTNKGYTYHVWRNYLTEGTMPPYTLMVSDQNGKTIVDQGAQVVKK